MNKYIRGDVNLSDLFLKEIPEIFKGVSIEGSLNLSKNGLTTLDNFPELVTENIELLNNPLISLVGIKQNFVKTLKVGGKFSDFEGCPANVTRLTCLGNLRLTSLKHMPTNILDVKIMATSLKSLEYLTQNQKCVYYLVDCKLKSLEGLPPNRCRSLNVSFNELKNFTGAPEIIHGVFNCAHNPITSLKGFPKEAENVIIHNFMNDHYLTTQEVRKVCITGKVTVM